ncbi:MAG: hypothetical protein BGO98_13845 [Myxococcales bacterium 68-20]|nr:MAG: hypothetical protein BGO98_13845 [Myxococcales bacterium 68-20]
MADAGSSVSLGDASPLWGVPARVDDVLGIPLSLGEACWRLVDDRCSEARRWLGRPLDTVRPAGGSSMTDERARKLSTAWEGRFDTVVLEARR